MVRNGVVFGHRPRMVGFPIGNEQNLRSLTLGRNPLRCHGAEGGWLRLGTGRDDGVGVQHTAAKLTSVF